MKVIDISPRLYAIRSYNYTKMKVMKNGIDSVKNQYVYRCLYVTEGRFDAVFGGERYTCEKGDVLYLVPGEEYGFVATEDFSIINLFFDMTDRGLGDAETSTCVMQSDFDRSLLPEVLKLSDGAALMHNRVFKGVSGAHLFSELLSSNRADVYFDLFAKVAISQIVYNLLTCEAKRRNAGAQRIISYINLNASAELSAEMLERKFGYHRNHINRMIKQETGRTLTAYIRYAKINYAKSLITESKLPQAQIAAELGYYDYSHFYKAFVQETGVSPTEFCR